VGQIDLSSLHDWQDGEIVTATLFKQDREIVRVAINDNFARRMTAFTVLNSDGSTKTSKNFDTAFNFLKLQDGTGVTLSMDVNGTVTIAATPAANSIGTTQLVDGSVTTTKIGDGAVTGAKIASLTIVTGNIADSAVTTSKIADLNVTNGKLADGSVSQTKLADASVSLSKLAPGSVDATKIVDGSVGSAELASGAVGTTALADGAVTSAKLATGAVGSSNLGAASVQSGNIADGAIITSKIGDGMVTAEKLDPTIAHDSPDISAHNGDPTAHQASTAAVPSSTMRRDASGRSQVAEPSASADIATKNYVDTGISSAVGGLTKDSVGLSNVSNKAQLPLDGSDFMNGSLRFNNGFAVRPVQNALNASDAITVYPLGMSYFTVGATQTGWPTSLGTVETLYDSVSRNIQYVYPKSLPYFYIRYWDDGASSWSGFTKISTDAVTLGGLSPSNSGAGNTIAQRQSDGALAISRLLDIGHVGASGESRIHYYNGGGVAEWLTGQKSGTDHKWRVTKMVSGNETDYVGVDPTNGNFEVPVGDILLRGTALAPTRLNGGLLEYWNGGAWVPVGAVKSLQRGITEMFDVLYPGDDKTVDVTISAVNTGKAMVNFPTILTATGSTGATTTTYAQLLNSTTLRLKHTLLTGAAGSHLQPRVSWEVIEYY
jgi:hypothetical protein